MTDQTQQNQLSQNVEREVRQLLGDLQMQIIVMRQMLELAQQAQQPAPRPAPEQSAPNVAPIVSEHRPLNGQRPREV